MSSVIAAPRMTIPARLRIWPASPSTWTETLTLVAVRATPRNKLAARSIPTTRPTTVPPASGRITPPKAVNREVLPTLRI